MRRCFSNLEPLTGLEVMLDMHSVDAEMHVVWTVSSQQLIEDSREIMLMVSDAVSVWPELSVSLVISVMVGMLIAGILMIEIFAFLFMII